MDFYCIPVWWLCSWLLIAKCHFVLPSVCFRLFSPLSEAELERKAPLKQRERGERERQREGRGRGAGRKRVSDTVLEVKVSSENEELSHLECFFLSLCLLNIDELSWIKETHKKREAKSCKMIYFTCWLEMCRFLNLVSFVLPSFGLHAHEFLRRLKVLEPISYHSAICFSFYIFNVALFLPNVIKSFRYPGSLPE